MSRNLYTAEEMAQELTEESDGHFSAEYVEELFEDLEEEGIVECVDGEHWDIRSYPAAVKFLWQNREMDGSPFPAINFRG